MQERNFNSASYSTSVARLTAYSFLGIVSTVATALLTLNPLMHQDHGLHFKEMDFQLLALEIVCMAVGAGIVILVLSARLRTRIRAIGSGVAAALILLVVTAFAPRVGTFAITAMSAVAGITGALAVSLLSGRDAN